MTIPTVRRTARFIPIRSAVARRVRIARRGSATPAFTRPRMPRTAAARARRARMELVGPMEHAAADAVERVRRVCVGLGTAVIVPMANAKAGSVRTGSAAAVIAV